MTFDKKAELNVLINLAASDKNVSEKEAKLIQAIGKANGIPAEEIKQMMQNPSPINNLSALTNEEKFEHLYYLIQLMKMDGQVFRSEVVFCEEIAEKLGYKRSVVGEISQHVYSDPSITADREMIRKKADKFLK